jgi:hypothetical protein
VRPSHIAARRAASIALALAASLIAPLTTQAQEGSQAPGERERWALVAIMAPGLHRIGLLIPLSERVLVRPDFQGYAFGYEGNADGWYANPGISLIVRTRPMDGSWVYASFRATGTVDVYEGWEDVSNAFTLTFGGHARLAPIFSVFGEAGPSFIYDEDPPDAYIYRTYNFVARFGFALHRPPTR